jgi:hypothetical protein
MRTVLIALLLLLVAPAPAQACNTKDIDFAVVLGVVGRQPVILRVAIHVSDRGEERASWSGTAVVIDHEGRRTPVPLPLGKHTLESAGQAWAQALTVAHKLPGFVPATIVGHTTCWDEDDRGTADNKRCGRALIDADTVVLTLDGRHRWPLLPPFVELDPETERAHLGINDVITWRAGDVELVTVHMGLGDPHHGWQTQVCARKDLCRTLSILHHAQGGEAVVVVPR